MALSEQDAHVIASLINERNHLATKHTAASILQHGDEYLFRKDQVSGEVIACVQVKEVQWYQAEILHLSVHESHEGRGHAKSLMKEAAAKAVDLGARVLQCTIREDNVASRGLFESFGYSCVSKFFNERTKNNVCVYQFTVSKARFKELI